MGDLLASEISGYRLLDSGDGRKLEEIAGWRVVRPCTQAIWRPRQGEDAWRAAASECHRSSRGGGRWQHHRDPPELELAWGEIRLELRFTGFGHCGVFFEQEPLWRRFRDHLRRAPGDRPARMANCFGYTGSASLAAAAIGAEVFHVDSAKGVLDWGRRSQARSGVAADSIRWIHDDVRSFLGLSRKRGWTYDLVFLDPPAFGHGRKKENWTFERDVAALVDDALAVVAPGGRLVLACHTPGVQREALVNLLRDAGRTIAGELGVAHAEDERILPAGIYAEVACA